MGSNSHSSARLFANGLCVIGLILAIVLPASPLAAAPPVPPPTFIPPIEAGFYGAAQDSVAGPMGLDVSIYGLGLRAIRDDLFIPACALPLQASFIYENAWRTNDSGWGYGWRYLYAASYLELTDGSLLIGPINGETQRYWPGSGGLSSPQPGRYELRTSEGTTYYFDDPDHMQVTKIASSGSGYLLLTYDAAGQLTRVSDHYGRHLDFSYAGGRLASVADANATPVRTVQYAYDAQGNLASVTDPLGHTTTYAYSAGHTLTRITDPLGNWATVTYLADERVSLIATPLSAVYFTHVEYERWTPQFAYENYTTVTDMAGGQSRTTRYDFNRSGQIVRTTDPRGYITSFGYDSHGNRTLVTDGKGDITRYQYDSADRLIRITDPLSRTTSYTYDPAAGEVASVTDPLGHTTRYEYDSQGRLIRQTDPLSNTTHYVYDCCNLIAVTDPLSHTTSYSHDAYGYPTAVQDGAGITATFRYDGRGDVLQVTDGRGRITTYGYDTLSRVLTITNPTGGSYRLSYHANGNLAQFVDPTGRVVNATYDALGRPVQLSDALGEVAYTFDSSGNITAITDGEGHQDTLSYNLQGRITSRNDELGRATTFVYDPAGNLIRRTDPLSYTTVYTYNAANLLTAVQYPDGSLATYSYDAAGNLTHEANSTVAVDYTYDAANRVTSVIAAGKTVSYTYDAAGRRATMTDPDGNVTTYSYDGGGRLLSVADPLAGTTTYIYDAAGRISRVDRANGVYSLYTYDAAGRLDSLTHHAPGGGVLTSHTYTYDLAGNRTSVTDAQGKTTSYTYDGRYRLVAVTYPDGTFTTYTYDLAGNRLAKDSTAYSYDDADQLLSAGTTTYGWDTRGNLASETTSGLAANYTYDHENRLTGSSYPDGTSVSTTYYPDGRLFSRTDRAGQTTHFVYDGPNLLLEADAGDGTVARYTSGLALDSWLALRRDGQTYTYLRDGLNSVTGLTDSSGALVAGYQYDAFGALRSQTGSVANPIRFTGRYWDEDASLYHYRARWYDPTTGRFLSRDPLNPILVHIPYAYASNNPATFVDPLGLDTWVCTGTKLSAGVLFGIEISRFTCRNTGSGEECDMKVTCYKLGALAGLGVNGCGGFQMNGPSSGWDLGGGGFSAFAEVGLGPATAEGQLSTEDPSQGGLNVCAGMGLGAEIGIGGQYCRTYVTSCKKKKEPEDEPEDPPHPPGGDHADDNYSAASPNLGFRIADSEMAPFSTIPYQRLSLGQTSAGDTEAPVPVSQPRVGILWHGYAEEATSLLASWGWVSVPVDLNFAPSSLGVPVLVIPSGGLYGLESASSLRARLEAYAAAGGTVIALAQQHGYEFSSLPGGQVGGYGWTEDNSCFDASLYVSEYHPILSGFSKDTLTAGVDGFFTSLPAGAQSLLHRTKSGQPAFVLYRYPPPSEGGDGGGYVVATSLYDDWSGAHHQPPADSVRLLRDLLSWAVGPDDPLPEFRPGESVTMPLTVTNGTSTEAARIQLTVLDPGGVVFSQQAITQTVPGGGQAQHIFQLFSPPGKLGIWWVQYALLDAHDNVVQPAAWGARFAISDPDPATGPGKTMGLSITAPGEYFNPGPATFTFHVYNFTDSERQATVAYGLPHHASETGDSDYGHGCCLPRTVTVTAQSEAIFTHTATILTDDRLFACLTYDHTHQQAWFQVRLQPVSVQVSTVTDEATYGRGQEVQATVTLTETVRAAATPILHLIAWDAQQRVLYSAEQTVSLAPGETMTAPFTFTVPTMAQPGTATLRAEIRDATGQVIGAGSNAFHIPNTPLVFATALPTVLSPGQSLVVTATNASPSLDVLTATLAVTLTDPAGMSQPLPPQPFALPAGQSLVLNVLLTTSVTQFGVYTFTLTSDDEYGTRAWQATAPNEPVLSIGLDQPAYAIRDVLRAEVRVWNPGRWQQSPALRVELSAAGYVQTDTLSLVAGAQVTTTHFVTLPAMLAAGSYPITATLIPTTGDPIAASDTVVIPDAGLRISLSDTTLTAGGALTLTVANDGGVDTPAGYQAWLQDARGTVVQAVTGTLADVHAGDSGAFTFTVPAAAVSGDYRVRGVLTNTQAGRSSSLTCLVAVDGLRAELKTVSERLMYTQGEPITAAVTITNTGPYAIEEATLHLAATGPPPWHWFTHIPAHHGPAGPVETIIVDSAGVKWLAASYAVSAFDDGGTPSDKSDDRWQVFDHVDGLCWNVRTVFVDATSRKWIGCEYDIELSLLDDGGTPFDKFDDRWLTYTAIDGLPQSVSDMAQDAAGYLWIATRDGVAALDPGSNPLSKGDDRWAHFAVETSGLAHNRVYAVAIDAGGNKWFATDGGVSVLDDGGDPFDGNGDTWHTFYEGTGLPSDAVQAMTFDAAGNKWFGGRYVGLSVLDTGASPFDGTGDRWHVFTPFNSGLWSYPIFSLAVDSADNIWIGVYGAVNALDAGADPFDGSGDTWGTFTHEDYLFGEVEAIYLDVGSLVWFGSFVWDVGGLALLDHGGTPFDQADDTWQAFTSIDVGISEGVTSIAAGPGGLTWFGDTSDCGEMGGVRVLDDGGTPEDTFDDRWAIFYVEDGLPANCVSALAIDQAGIVWAAGYGVGALDHGGTPFDKSDDAWQTFGVGDIGLYNTYVMAVDAANRKWVGGSGPGGGATLAVLDDGGTPLTKTDDLTMTFTSADGLPGIPYRALAIDQAGVKWIGVSGEAAALWDAGTPFTKTDDVWVTFTAADGLGDGTINGISVDGQNTIWFATSDSGVSVLDYNGTLSDKLDDTWHTYQADGGLVDNDVRGIAVDTQGDKWIGTYNRGVSLLGDGGDPFDGLGDTWQTFTTAHGLRSNSIRVVAPGGDGRIWAGTYGDGASVALRGGTSTWGADVPVDSLLPAQVTQTLTSVTGLSDPGRYRLTADLFSASGQTVVSDWAPFYIVPWEAALTLDATPDPLRPGGAITVASALINDGLAELTNQTVTIAQDGTPIHTEGPFDVPAGDSYAFTVTASAPGSVGTTTFAASTDGLSVQQEVAVAQPAIVASASAPAVVGSEPFSVTVSLTNTGSIAGRVNVDFGFIPQPTVVDVPAGETALLQRETQVCTNTTLEISLTGDLTETLSLPVTFGQAIDFRFSPQGVFLSGLAQVPYTIANVGQLDVPLHLAFRGDEGSDIPDLAFDLYLPVGDALQDSLLLDLGAGTQTMIYNHVGLPAVCSLASGAHTLEVIEETSATLSATASVSGPSALITATVSNTGGGDVAGTLRLTTDYDVQMEQPVTVAVGASGTYTFSTEVSLAMPGAHTATLTVLDGQGTSPIAQTAVTFTVQGPALRVISLPADTLLPVSQTVTVTFGVENSGGQEGQARLRFTLGDIVDETQVRQVAVGSAEPFDFRFFVPADLEAKPYLATYDLNGQQGQLAFSVQGISLTVSTGTDRPSYTEGEPVTFLLTVTNNLPATTSDLYALVSLGGVTQTQGFTLSAVAVGLTFPLTATFTDGGLVFYGIYHPASQRGITLNTLRLGQQLPAVTVLLDHEVYTPGDPVQASVLTTVTGQLAISAPGYTTTLPLSGSDTGFTFTLPSPMARGSYAVNYRLTGCACPEEGRQYQAPFDVAGPLVRVIEAQPGRMRYSPGDLVNVRLTVASDREVDALLRSALTYPNGSGGSTTEQAVHLSSQMDNMLTATATITDTQAGLHLLSYELVDAADATLIYAQGVEAFDVGLASLLDVATGQASYLTTSDPVTAVVQLFASAPLSGQLSLTLDGTAPEVETLGMAAGLQTVNLGLTGPITPGHRTLTVTLSVGALASQARASFDYGTDLPDLVTGPPSLVPTGTLTSKLLAVLISNGGRSAAPATKVNVYNGEPGVGVLIGTGTIPALGVGESAVAMVAWDDTGQGGEHELHALVDPEGSVTEFDETNNHSQGLIILPRLDLQVTTDQTSYEEGKRVTVQSSLINLQGEHTLALTLTTTLWDPLQEVVLSQVGDYLLASSEVLAVTHTWESAGGLLGRYLVEGETVDEYGGRIMDHTSFALVTAPTPTPTETFTPTATYTPTPIVTDTPIPTATDTPVTTDTPTPTATGTSTPTATYVPTPIVTDTPTPTSTPMRPWALYLPLILRSPRPLEVAYPVYLPPILHDRPQMLTGR